MAFWTRVKGEVKKAAQEGWEAVKGGTKAATSKGEELAKTGKLRYRVRAKHKEAEKLFAELGGVVYDMSTPPCEDIFSKPEVERLVDTIKAVEDEIASIEGEIDEIKQSHVEAGDGTDAVAAAKVKDEAEPKAEPEAKSDEGDDGEGDTEEKKDDAN